MKPLIAKIVGPNVMGEICWNQAASNVRTKDRVVWHSVAGRFATVEFIVDTLWDETIRRIRGNANFELLKVYNAAMSTKGALTFQYESITPQRSTSLTGGYRIFFRGLDNRLFEFRQSDSMIGLQRTDSEISIPMTQLYTGTGYLYRNADATDIAVEQQKIVSLGDKVSVMIKDETHNSIRVSLKEPLLFSYKNTSRNLTGYVTAILRDRNGVCHAVEVLNDVGTDVELRFVGPVPHLPYSGMYPDNVLLSNISLVTTPWL